MTAFDVGTMTIAGSTTTMSTGGYSLQLATVNYDLQIVGPLGTYSRSGITVGTQNQKFDYYNGSMAAIPEPSSVVLLFLLFAVLLFYGRRLRASRGT